MCFFFAKKRLKSIFEKFSELMLNVDKMQNISTLKCKVTSVIHQSSLVGRYLSVTCP